MFNSIQYPGMSLKVIKAGILDTIQDRGRYGYRKYGINPTGVMDCEASRKANLIVGNAMDEAVIELHFPASAFLFERPAVIALTGADFSATIDDQFIANNTSVSVHEKSVLRFTHPKNGARSYLAIRGRIEISKWLNSYSTHLKAGIGGLHGTRLKKDDIIFFSQKSSDIISYKNLNQLLNPVDEIHVVNVLSGNEWNWLSENDQGIFLNSEYSISPKSDRMGYKLIGGKINIAGKTDLVSSPVCFGTIQILPDGSLILLMADHQTTGGYPRIASVITAHHSILAQKRPGDHIRFELTDILTAEKLLFQKEDEIIGDGYQL